MPIVRARKLCECRTGKEAYVTDMPRRPPNLTLIFALCILGTVLVQVACFYVLDGMQRMLSSAWWILLTVLTQIACFYVVSRILRRNRKVIVDHGARRKNAN